MKKLVCMLLVMLTLVMLLASCSTKENEPKLIKGKANNIWIYDFEHPAAAQSDTIGVTLGPGFFEYINDTTIKYKVSSDAQKAQYQGRTFYISTSNIIKMEIIYDTLD